MTSLPDYKDSFAEAYLFAISAAAGLPIERSTRRTDNLGIDLTLSKKNDSVSPGSQINIQLKGVAENSASMFKEDERSISYNFHNPCNPIGAHYLVVVRLPNDGTPEDWLTLTEKELIIRKCAFYTKIVPKMKSGFVKIPKTQLLTHNNLPTLFPSAIDLVNNL